MSKLVSLYGFHAITRRLRQYPGRVERLYVDEQRQDGRMHTLLALAKGAGIQIHPVNSERLIGLCGSTQHQGVVAQVQELTPPNDLDQILTCNGANTLLLILDGVQDPHNLGACLRVADAMGACALIAPRDRSVSMSATVAKVACGAAETVPYLSVTNLVRTMDQLQERGIWVTGTSDQAKISLATAAITLPMAWVLGSEGAGLRRLTTEHCDELVRIPMVGAVESLNVSVAAGICLYHTRLRLGTWLNAANISSSN